MPSSGLCGYHAHQWCTDIMQTKHSYILKKINKLDTVVHTWNHSAGEVKPGRSWKLLADQLTTPGRALETAGRSTSLAYLASTRPANNPISKHKVDSGWGMTDEIIPGLHTPALVPYAPAHTPKKQESTSATPVATTMCAAIVPHKR